MIKISKNIIEEVKKHAEEESPLEACGYLAGKNGKVSLLFRMTNVDQSPEHFSFDPKEQFKIMKEARSKGLELIAVYHSHPNSPARLSDEDIRLAHDPEMVYVIHSLLNGETKAFKDCSEVPIEEII